MAEAHGKLSGRPGVCMVTRGPGATNASIGVHTAFQDSTPMVLLVGDVASDCRDREAFQEVDFFSFFGPLAKRVERIDCAQRIPEYVARAFATAMNGRPGPVVLVLPEDMLTESVPADMVPVERIDAVEAWSDPGSLRRLRELLMQARAPLVIAGGGGWTQQSAQALQRFAENWHLPVANAFRFQDTFDNHHVLYVGDVGIGINPVLAKAVRDSDLLIVIGPRLGEMTTSGYTLLKSPKPKQALVHIHADANELHRVYHADLAICATMNAAARSLEVLTAPVDVAWLAHTHALANAYLANLVPNALPGFDADAPRGPVDMAEVIFCAQRLLPANAFLTNGAGNFAGWLSRYFRYHGLAKGFKTQLAPTNGAMGYGVPAGIGAAIATQRLAFTIAGDGDFMMNGQELATAAQHGAKVIIVLVNNGVYGTIRMHQEREYPSRDAGAGSNLVNPDFCALAGAYGLASARVVSTAAFEPALAAALARANSSLIEIMLDADIISTRTTLTAINAAVKAAQSH